MVKFSGHAIMRIERGDPRKGKRTCLSLDEIAAIIASGIAISRPSWEDRTSHLFYSEKDGKCLRAIVASDGEVVTLSPANGERYTERLLAERRVKGDSVLSAEMPAMPTCRHKDYAVSLGIRYYSRERRDEWNDEVFIITWFDFKNILFANRLFLETLVACIDTNLNKPRLRFCDAVLCLRGGGWRDELPISLPYELLAKEPPYKI